MRICFASHNKNKVKEIADLVPAGIEIVGLDSFNISEEIAETGSTLADNSRIKAQYVYSIINTPVFADDSGLEVQALNGEPGVHSARYAGPEKNDEKNIDLLLRNLEGITETSAQFRTIITFIGIDGNEIQFEGKMNGHIVKVRKGENGFGYDPIFKPDGYTQTFAEMDMKQKNMLSHRAKAFNKLLSYLAKING